MDMMIDGGGGSIRTGEEAGAAPAGQSYAQTAQSAPPPAPPPPAPEHKSWWDSAVDDVKSAGSAVDNAMHSAGNAVDHAATSTINTVTGVVRDVAGNTAANAFHGAASAVQNQVKQTVGFDYGLASGATQAVGSMVESTGGLVQGGYKMATDSQYRGQVVQGAEHFAQQVADHPGATAKAIGSAVVTGGKDWIAGAGKAAQEGNLGEYLGKSTGSAVVNVGSFFIPGADAADVANIAGHAAEAGNVLTKGAEAGNVVTKAADAGNLVSHGAEATNAVTHSADATNVLTHGADAGSAVTHGADASSAATHTGEATTAADHAAEATHTATTAEHETATDAHTADEAQQTQSATRGIKRPADDLDHVDDGGAAAKRARTEAQPAQDAKPTGPVTHTETASYGQNKVTWTLGEDGRPLHAEGTLKESSSGLVRGKDELAAQSRTTDRAGALADDHAGHIVGHRFMADQDVKNLFPQNGNFNTGAYKTMENEWAAWTQKGGEIHFKVDLEGGSADRPGKVIVNYEVRNSTGKAIYDNQFEFDNRAGQTFDRVPTKNMSGLLK